VKLLTEYLERAIQLENMAEQSAPGPSTGLSQARRKAGRELWTASPQSWARGQARLGIMHQRGYGASSEGYEG
jgi:hypothetical protein